MRTRAERIEAMARTLYLAAETDLATVLGQIDALEPELVVVDSVQTIASAEVEGSAGNVTQVREVAASLIQVAKARGIAALLVGHVTKDGSIAGPAGARAPRRRRRAVRGRPALPAAARAGGQEPLRPHRRGRLLRPVRRRHRRACPTPAGCSCPRRTTAVRRHLRHGDPRGPPAAGDRGPGPGRASRPCPPRAARPQRARLRPGRHDPRRARQAGQRPDRRRATSTSSTVGGVRLTEPAADLAIAWPSPAPSSTSRSRTARIAFGEVGLAGEIRPVTGCPPPPRRGRRLGFRTRLVPPGSRRRRPGARRHAGRRGRHGGRASPRPSRRWAARRCRGHAARRPSPRAR